MDSVIKVSLFISSLSQEQHREQLHLGAGSLQVWSEGPTGDRVPAVQQVRDSTLGAISRD